MHNFWNKLGRTVLCLCCCANVVPAPYPQLKIQGRFPIYGSCVKLKWPEPKYAWAMLTLSITFNPVVTLTHAVDQGALKWRESYKCASVYVQLCWYSNFLLVCLFFTQMYTKRPANMHTKFWENMLTGFWLMHFASNWHDPGHSMHKLLESDLQLSWRQR